MDDAAFNCHEDLMFTKSEFFKNFFFYRSE